MNFTILDFIRPYKVVLTLHDGDILEMSYPYKFLAEHFIRELPSMQIDGKWTQVRSARLVPKGEDPWKRN